MLGKLGKTANSLHAYAAEASNAAKKQASELNQSVKNTSLAFENKAIGVKDGIVSVATSVAETGTRSVKTAMNITSFLAEVGLVIGAVTAPVPTFIGLCLLWLIEEQIKEIRGNFDQSLREGREARRFERVTSIIKKYGKIPETATLKTHLLTMDINSQTGVVAGTILAGKHKGRSLQSLTDDEVTTLISVAKDRDSAKLLEAYMAIRSSS